MPAPKTLTARFCDTADRTTSGEYRDAGEPGLIFRVWPSGTRSWAMLYYRPGSKRRTRVTLGQYPAVSLADARKMAREIKRQLDDGDDPRAPRKCREDLVTFKDLARLYPKRYSKPRKRTWRTDERILEKNILPYLGELRLDRITRGDVLEVVEAVEARNALVQGQRTYETIRGVFRWGLAQDYIQRDPTYGIKRRHKRPIRDRFLSDEEIAHVWRTLPTVMKPMYVSVLRLTIATGQRIGEVCSARITDFDMTRRLWTIPADTAKNGMTHTVYLTDLTVALIREAITAFKGKTYLFPSLPRSRTTQPPHEQPLGTMTPIKALKAARRELGLEANPATAHDFRRTFATGLQRFGIREEVVARCLNHRSDTARTITAAVYMKYAFEDEKRAAFGLWSDHISDLTAHAEGKKSVIDLTRVA